MGPHQQLCVHLSTPAVQQVRQNGKTEILAGTPILAKKFNS